MMGRLLFTSIIAASLSLPACAHNQHTGGIQSTDNKTVLAPFDIIHTKITTKGNVAIFHMPFLVMRVQVNQLKQEN